MNDRKAGAHKTGKKSAKRSRKSGPARPPQLTGGVSSVRAPLPPAPKLPKRRDPQTLAQDDRTFSQRRFGAGAKNESEPDRRLVQIELKRPLRRIPVRAKSRSAFRFTTAGGRHIPRLHDILNHHALREAHPSFRGRHPGQRRRRSQAEKDHISRFVDLHFPAEANIESILRDLRGLPQVARAIEVRGIIPSAIPSDPLIGTSDQLASDPNSGFEFQWYVFRCGVDRAWARTTGEGVVIADVDAGFFLDHQDLVANIELAHAHNAVDGSNDVTAGAETDHGTAVLGIAGAASNAVGIAGFAFGAKLWPVQADAGKGPSLPGDPLANAIDWVLGENSDGRRVVINIEAQTSSNSYAVWP